MFRKPFWFALMLGIALAGTVGPLAAQILKKEPAMGQLREGQTVMVDDGSCPTGQIKAVTGGNHVKAGGTKQVTRIRKCVPR